MLLPMVVILPQLFVLRCPSKSTPSLLEKWTRFSQAVVSILGNSNQLAVRYTPAGLLSSGTFSITKTIEANEITSWFSSPLQVYCQLFSNFSNSSVYQLNHLLEYSTSSSSAPVNILSRVVSPESSIFTCDFHRQIFLPTHQNKCHLPFY